MVQQTGSMDNTTGIFTVTETGFYSINFYGLATISHGEYQLLLNGAYGIGSSLGYCWAGNDQSAFPVMIAVLGTAYMTVNTMLSVGDTLQVTNANVAITVQGNEDGPATVFNVIKWA